MSGEERRDGDGGGVRISSASRVLEALEQLTDIGPDFPDPVTAATEICAAAERSMARWRRISDDPDAHIEALVEEATDPAGFIEARCYEAIDDAIGAAWFPGPGLLDDLEQWTPPHTPVTALLAPDAVERRWGLVLAVEVRALMEAGRDDLAEAIKREWALRWAAHGHANLAFSGLLVEPSVAALVEAEVARRNGGERGADAARQQADARWAFIERRWSELAVMIPDQTRRAEEIAQEYQRRAADRPGKRSITPRYILDRCGTPKKR